jgi:hypothetical protein
MHDSNPDDIKQPGTRFDVEIQPVLPARFARLEELANDLYFSWNRGVRGLFRHLDPDSWNACGHNPRVFMRRLRRTVSTGRRATRSCCPSIATCWPPTIPTSKSSR